MPARSSAKLSAAGCVAVAALVGSLVCGSCRRTSVSITALGSGDAEPLIRVKLTTAQERAVVAIDGPFLVRQGVRVLFSGSRLGSCALRTGPKGFRLGKLHFAGDSIDLIPQRDGTLRFAGRRYRGLLRCYRRGSPPGLVVVNVVKLESYLASVVGSEMPGNFGQSALEAQAVAARTYALHCRASRGASSLYDVLDSTADQVYRGMDSESDRTWQAVHRTAGVVLVWGTGRKARIFRAYYCSNCGGATQDARYVFDLPSIPPLAGRVDEYCSGGAFDRWPAVGIAKDEIDRLLRARYAEPMSRLGPVTSVKAVRFERNGRPVLLVVADANGRKIYLKAEDFRLAVGPDRLKSTWCRIVDAGREVRFVDGRGYGHGVGMCQYGADGMARAGKNAVQILLYYYPGAHLERAYRAETPATAQTGIRASGGA